MKNNIFSNLSLVFLGIMLAMSLTGCFQKEKPAGTGTDTQLVVVETQQAELTSHDKYHYSFDILVDVPVCGPQRLMDSLKVFLNKYIYDAFDAITKEYDNSTSYLSEEKVFHEDLTNILSYYESQYKPCEKKIDSYLSVKLFLLAQTASFITYGLEYYHCGASCASEFACFTFDKKDGHLVKDIISIKKLCNFVKKHPDYKPPYLDMWNVDNNTILENAVGLLDDRIVIVDYGSKHYSTVQIDYDEIESSLSKEAQKLIASSDKDNPSYYVENWHLGRRIGTMTDKNGKKIFLSERFLSNFDGDCGYDLYKETQSEASSHVLTAFSSANGTIQEENVFPKGNGEYVSKIEPNWDELISSFPDDHSFAFNPDGNTLYIPLAENFHMGYHPACDRYDVYQIKGEHFSYKGEDGGFWLHPSIRNFGRLCLIGKTDMYLVRVDEMRLYDTRYDDQAAAERRDTHRYRYVAWEYPKTMMDEPDLVINGGYMEEGSYLFENNGYTYMVYPEMGRLYVHHGDKQILEEPLYDIKSFSE
ncbi:MAG: hypothetical protein J5741_00380 [Bacteroidales bacterium]|nr:hypothetical protein [Bacteroidales bacterium]